MDYAYHAGFGSHLKAHMYTLGFLSQLTQQQKRKDRVHWSVEKSKRAAESERYTDGHSCAENAGEREPHLKEARHTGIAGDFHDFWLLILFSHHFLCVL